MPTKRKPKAPAPYKSMLEYNLHKSSLAHLDYEPSYAKMTYQITDTKKYTPDFVDPNNRNIVYEVKGRCRTFDEAKKYLHIRKSNPGITIRFILMRRGTKAYPQSKQTFEEWLEMHKFEWCLYDNIPLEWLE